MLIGPFLILRGWIEVGHVQTCQARRLTQDEGTYLLRLVRRGRADTIRYRRALMILASSSGTAVPATDLVVE